jgi:alpha-galactosidase
MRVALESPDTDAFERYERTRLAQRLAHVRHSDPAYAAVLEREWQAEHPDGARRRSDEYGSLIIHSLETGTPRVVYGNVQNDGLIDNLPQGCCVEVPCLVDKNGLQPTRVGSLPPQLAALMQTNINVQSLTVEAALTGRREHIYHAAMLDPHTAAELDLDQIWHLVDDLIAAHGDWLPQFT